jgi:hypothetical protein
MNTELSYLEDYLREEFSDCHDVRISMVFPSGTARSLDLEQDYDESTGTIHKRAGVIVRTKRSEYFFPQEWAMQNNRTNIDKQIEAIKTVISHCAQ